MPHKQTLASTIISGQPHICITNAHAKVKAPTNTVTAPGPPAATAPDTCGSVTGDTSATGASEPLATIDADADLLLLPLLVTLMLRLALINHFRLLPGLARSTGGALNHNIRMEFMMGLVVVVLAVLLSVLQPTLG